MKLEQSSYVWLDSRVMRSWYVSLFDLLVMHFSADTRSDGSKIRKAICMFDLHDSSLTRVEIRSSVDISTLVRLS